MRKTVTASSISTRGSNHVRKMPQQSISMFIKPLGNKATVVQAGRQDAQNDPLSSEETIPEGNEKPVKVASIFSGQKRKQADSSSQDEIRPANKQSIVASPPVENLADVPAPLSKEEMETLASSRLADCKKVITNHGTSNATPIPLQLLLLEPSWQNALQSEMKKSYFTQLSTFVHKEYAGSTPIYPPREMIFRTFNSCPLHQVRVVILGQDPYPNAGQAMGLCFSVNKGIRVPQSLINIYKEIHEDLGCPIPSHGDLSSWSTQGVLMLNTLLTVRGKAANSHKGKGWEEFTNAAISAISKQCTGVVFLLWGKPAQEKAKLINSTKHHVLTAPHPSPLAAASGKLFVGCRHFSTANELLVKQGKPPIDWCIR